MGINCWTRNAISMRMDSVKQEAQETCASNGGHCVSNCGNGNSGLNCNDACNALGIFTDKPKCNGLGNGNYDCSGVNNVCCGCFS